MIHMGSYQNRFRQREDQAGQEDQLQYKNKMSRVTGLETDAALKTKTTGIENKIPNFTNLTATASVNGKATDVESNIPDITNLSTKFVLNTKATEIEK